MASNPPIRTVQGIIATVCDPCNGLRVGCERTYANPPHRDVCSGRARVSRRSCEAGVWADSGRSALDPEGGKFGEGPWVTSLALQVAEDGGDDVIVEDEDPLEEFGPALGPGRVPRALQGAASAPGASHGRSEAVRCVPGGVRERASGAGGGQQRGSPDREPIRDGGNGGLTTAGLG